MKTMTNKTNTLQLALIGLTASVLTATFTAGDTPSLEMQTFPSS